MKMSMLLRHLRFNPPLFTPPPPLKTREIEGPKDQPIEIPVDPVEAAAIEAHNEHVRLYFLSTYPPGERLK
jgi:hypothetical protein